MKNEFKPPPKIDKTEKINGRGVEWFGMAFACV
jgi:hypothetical protein